MPAYVIGQIRARSWGWLDDYARPVAALIRKHGGRYLVRGGAPQRLEGDVEPPALVVLEFPSAGHARAWYEDPAYAPWIELRRRHADVDLVIVEGMPSGQAPAPGD